MSRDFVPAADAQFDLWLSNFSDRLAELGVDLGFSTVELASFTQAVQQWKVAFAAHGVAQNAAKSATSDKKDKRKIVVDLARAFARRVQAHPTTDDALRNEMGLTPSSPAALSLSGAAALAADASPLLLLDFGSRGQIKIHFGPNPANENRNGLPAGAIGAIVQGRGDPDESETAEWQWIATPTSSPYTHLLQPAASIVMEYRCAYLFRKGRTGPWSAAVQAAVTP